ncbi:MAG: hypothetical protein ABI743_12395 [bacterium]
MSQSAPALVAAAQDLERQACAFYAQARGETDDPLLIATLHFLETQRQLALHQLLDEAARLTPEPIAPRQ